MGWHHLNHVGGYVSRPCRPSEVYRLLPILCLISVQRFGWNINFRACSKSVREGCRIDQRRIQIVGIYPNQSRAVFEGIGIDMVECARKIDLLQSGTILEGCHVDGGHMIRNGVGAEAGASFKSLAWYLPAVVVFGPLGALQAGAVIENPNSDVFHRSRNAYGLQVLAASESVVADAGHCFRNTDSQKFVAIAKGTVCKAGDGVGHIFVSHRARQHADVIVRQVGGVWEITNSHIVVLIVGYRILEIPVRVRELCEHLRHSRCHQQEEQGGSQCPFAM